ncbi:MAG: HdeD family acid-resistance protein [Hyphomicrobium sp.]
MISSGLTPTVLETLAEKRKHIVWTGIAMTIVGILALSFPFFTTITVEIFTGWIFLLAGATTTYGAFSLHGTGPFFGQLLFGLLKVALGIYMISHTEEGILGLTLILSALFMIDGAVQFGLALELRPHRGWFWIFASGLISISVGLLIAAGFPETSLFALGLLVGINFLSTGISLIFLSGLLPSERY